MEKQYNITSVDAANVVRLIDAVSERGAFKGAELSAVGLVRDKFFAIVQDAKSSQAEAITTAQG